jgi:hemin uptake protein HemP
MPGETSRSDEPKGSGSTAVESGDTVRRMRSTELFGGSREIVIQHDQHVYRLKQTSRGGLILTK